MFKQLNRKTVYQNKWMKVYEDEIQFPDGSQGIYGFVERSPGVVVMILNEKDEVFLLKQYRYPVQNWMWEFPGGAIDPGENLETAVKREVAEETGLELHSIEKIGQFFPISSFSTESDALFLARTNSPLTALKSSEHDESFAEMKFVNITDALKMIDSGEINDTYTSNALQILARRMKK